jgi:hypothetical protein
MPEQWQHELRKLQHLDPPPGLWDRAVLGSSRQPRRIRGTGRIVAPVAAALAIAAVAAGTFALVQGSGPAPQRPGPVPASRPGHFVDPGLGWSIRVRAGLTAQHFLTPGRVTSNGVRVTNFPPSLEAPSQGSPPMGWLRQFPADGVAVQIWSDEGGPAAGPPPLRDSTFPLSPSSFQRVSPYVGGSEPRPWYRGLSGDGFGLTAAVWIGPRASRADRQAAWAVVRSLRFPRLREGTFWLGTYYVLGPASRYPTGSVTAFPRSSLPGSRAVSAKVPEGFYLIHAPRAFYVIPRLAQKPTAPDTTCTLAFNKKAFQFYCPGTSLRWNRIGRPVGANAKNAPGWSLGLVPATVAQDGHILFSPFWGGVLGVDLHGSPWG